MQVLYELEFSERGWPEVLADQILQRSSTEQTESYAQELLAATVESRDALDEKITALLENWDLGRLSLIDKNILRYALAEIMFFPAIPTKVIINEAIEIGNKYSSAEAGGLINGLLDRFAKEFRSPDTSS